MAVRYATTRIVGDLKDTLGLSVKKNLRECVYNKIVRLGVRSTDDMSMAGLTQIALEGVEQLDKIVFIEDGRVEAVGPHDELYRSCAEYRRMVDLQKLEDEEGGGSHG